MSTEEIYIGISSCVLGEKVRYDGGHKRNAYITDILSTLLTFVPVCPEVEIGLGIPRDPIQLIQTSGGIQLIAPTSGANHTRAMTKYAKLKVKELGQHNLSGYILKSKSPSCGLDKVPIYNPGEDQASTGRGLFADALLKEYPLLPVEDEDRLGNPHLRENFIQRVYAYRRLKNLFSSRWTSEQLVNFHTREKLLLLSHDPVICEELGRLVGNAKGTRKEKLAEKYQCQFMAALKNLATTRKDQNVLHLLK